MEWTMILVKLVIGFVGLWLMTRLLGKKEIKNLTPFDFISSLLMSDIVGETLYSEEVSYGMLVFALAVWFLLSYAFEKVAQHAKKLRGALEGKPSIIIRAGEIDFKEMRRNNINFGQLLMLLRQQGVFTVREVAYAIFEPNGSLSIMKQPRYESVIREDLQLKEEEAQLPVSIVEDGKVKENNLRSIGRDQDWLYRQMKAENIESLDEVAYAEWLEDKGLFIMRHGEF